MREGLEKQILELPELEADTSVQTLLAMGEVGGVGWVISTFRKIAINFEKFRMIHIRFF